MKFKTQACFRLSAIVGLLALLVPGVATFAQTAAEPQGYPQDWSHRHLIFSQPETFEQIFSETESSGKTSSRSGSRGKALSNDQTFERLDRYYEIMEDPRYLIQLQQRERESAALAAEAGLSGSEATEWIAQDAADARAWDHMVSSTQAATTGGASRVQKKPPAPPTTVGGNEIDRDWSNVMGGALGKGASRVYPAKYAFTTASKSCTNDFVVYTTASAGATGSGVKASLTGTFTDESENNRVFTITNGSRVLTLTASDSNNTGFFFVRGNDNGVTSATNLISAINRNGGYVGVTASAGAAKQVIVTAITQGAGGNSITAADDTGRFSWANSPATSSFTGGSGTAGQPTIFALNQLYDDLNANGGCQTGAQPLPAALWSYNTTTTGTGSTADLSPVLSLDGTQVAFVQRTSGNVAQLVLLKLSSTPSGGTVGAPTTPNLAATAADYRNNTGACVATTVACMYVMTFSGNPNDTNSSPFVDYSGDILYVGDDSGNVHKFTGVFAGTPVEAGSPWPVSVGTTSVISSPIAFSGQVFVGSNGPDLTGNRLHRISASSGTVVSSGPIGSASAVNGVRDAPIGDVSLGRVYAFQGAYTTTVLNEIDTTSTNCGTGAIGQVCNAVFQFSTSFGGGTSGLGRVFVGLSTADGTLATSMNSGAFDEAYYSSVDGTGSLYVCGSQLSTANRPTIWKVGLSAGGIFSTKTLGPQLTNDATTDGCSPPMVFKNGSDEFLYASVSANGAAQGGGGCVTPAAGCMYAYNMTRPAGFSATTVNRKVKWDETKYISVSQDDGTKGNIKDADTLVTAARAGSYSGMVITQGASAASPLTLTYTLMKNVADVATLFIPTVSCQILPGDTECNSSQGFTLATNDLIAVRIAGGGGSGELTTDYSVQLLRPFGPLIVPNAALNATGGTGGIVIDNVLAGGGSQIYYATRASPGNAIQASQKALE